MKVRMNVSTIHGAKPGDVAEVSEREGRTLIAGGFATPAPEKKRKTKDPEATATGEKDDQKQEG